MGMLSSQKNLLSFGNLCQQRRGVRAPKVIKTDTRRELGTSGTRQFAAKRSTKSRANFQNIRDFRPTPDHRFTITMKTSLLSSKSEMRLNSKDSLRNISKMKCKIWRSRDRHWRWKSCCQIMLSIHTKLVKNWAQSLVKNRLAEIWKSFFERKRLKRTR